MRLALFFMFLLCSFPSWSGTEPAVLELIDAAKAGDIAKMRQLFAKGVDVNGRDYATTALDRAIAAKQTAAVKLLLETGANPNSPSAQSTPLYLAAAFAGVPDIVDLLLKHGADPNLALAQAWQAISLPQPGRKDTVLDTPLHGLAWRALYSQTPEADQLAVARLLISAGARVDQLNANGSTPLRNAINQNQVGLAKIFLEAGADPNRVTEIKYVDFEYGETPLLHAIATYRGDLSMVQLLLDHGANINYRNDRPYFDGPPNHDTEWNGISPLILASESGHLDVVKLLIKRGANPCIKRTDGASPFEIAVKAEQPKIAELLKIHMQEKGCSPP